MPTQSISHSPSDTLRLSRNDAVEARLCRPRPTAAGRVLSACGSVFNMLRLVCDTAALLFQTGSHVGGYELIAAPRRVVLEILDTRAHAH